MGLVNFREKNSIFFLLTFARISMFQHFRAEHSQNQFFVARYLKFRIFVDFAEIFLQNFRRFSLQQ